MEQRKSYQIFSKNGQDSSGRSQKQYDPRLLRQVQKYRKIVETSENHLNQRHPQHDKQTRFCNILTELYHIDEQQFEKLVSNLEVEKLRECVSTFSRNFTAKGESNDVKLASIITSYESIINLITKGEAIDLDEIPWYSNSVGNEVSRSITTLIKMCNQRVFLSQCTDRSKRFIEEESLLKFVDQESVRWILHVRKSILIRERIIQSKRKIDRLKFQSYIRSADSFPFEKPFAVVQSLSSDSPPRDQILRLNQQLKMAKDGFKSIEISNYHFEQFLKQKKEKMAQLRSNLLMRLQKMGQKEKRSFSFEQSPKEHKNIKKTEKYIYQPCSLQQYQKKDCCLQYQDQHVKTQQKVLTYPSDRLERTQQRIEQDVYVRTPSRLDQESPVNAVVENPNQLERVHQNQDQQELSIDNNGGQAKPVIYKLENSQSLQDRCQRSKIFTLARKSKRIKKFTTYTSLLVSLDRFLKKRGQKFTIKVPRLIFSKEIGFLSKRCLVIQLERCNYLSKKDQQEEQKLKWKKQIQKCHYEIDFLKQQVNIYQQTDQRCFAKHIPRQAGQRIGPYNINILLSQYKRQCFQVSRQESPWIDQNK